MTDFFCRQSFINCPYRLWDLGRGYPICNYFNLSNQFSINREFSKIPSLVSKACKWVQKEEKRLDFIRRIAKKRGQALLERAQVGDTVYNRRGIYHKVKLLERPSRDSIFVTCETPKGGIIRVQLCDLVRISKGSFCGEFFIGEKSEGELKILKNKIMYHGFRVEIERKGNGNLLKIYGDSQQEIDDFITYSIEQNFDISSYI